MKWGGAQRPQTELGFTVVETLIVLAVTSALFVSAAFYINGKQNRSDFLVGSRQIVQQLQEAINQTQTGYYPRSSDFKCTVGGGSNVNITSGSDSLGASNDCIFAGTSIIFNPSQAGGANEQYVSYALAAARQYTSGSQRKDVDSPKVAKITANPYTVQTTKIQNGLSYYGSRVGVGVWNTTTKYPVTLLSSFGNFGGGTEPTQGSQRIELRGATALWGGAGTDVSKINDEAAQPDPYGTAPLSGVELCFNSGGTDQSVVVTVSGGLSVNHAIKTGLNCP